MSIEEYHSGLRPYVERVTHFIETESPIETPADEEIYEIDEEKEKDDSPADGRVEHDKEDFPEGGFGWVVVLGTWLVMACTFGIVNSFGVYQSHYETVQFPDEKAFKISVIGSLQAAVFQFSTLLGIPLMHHLPSQLVVLIGGVIQIFALMMMSLTTSMWQLFLSQGLVFGVGSGILYISGVSILMEWFKLKRAMLMGIASSGSSLGGVYWPIAVRRLIEEVGVDWTNRIIGFIFIPISCVMVICLKTRLPKTKAAGEKVMDFSVLTNLKFLWLILLYAVGTLGLFPGLFYIDLYGQRMKGINPRIGDNLVSILNGASLFGRVLPGIMADKIGRMNTLAPCLILSGVFPLALWLPASHSQALLVVYVVCWGFTSGVFVSLIPTLVVQLFGIKGSKSRMSFFFAAGGVAALFGPMICGSFLPLESDSLGLQGFNKLIIFVGVVMLACSFMQLALRLSYSRKLNVFI